MRASDGFESWDLDWRDYANHANLDAVAAAVARDCEECGGYDVGDRRGPMTVSVWVGDPYDADPLDEGWAEAEVGPPVPDCEPCYDDAPEPDDEDGHAWSSSNEAAEDCGVSLGVRGNGGGIICLEVCVRCGLFRRTNTWDQSFTGTGEPVATVEYFTGV